MMENRIKALKNVSLNFDNIKSEVWKNIEVAFEAKKITANKRLPYMRAIRTVSYALCVCMAAGMIGLAAHRGGFDWLMGMPGELPGTSIEESKGSHIDLPEDRLPSPEKNPNFARKYDRFFAFATFVNPNVIVNSNLLSEADNRIFSEYAERSQSRSYIIYMGTKNDTDCITIFDWYGEGDEGDFEFSSNLEYRYEDIISEFEQASGREITNDFLSDTSMTDTLTNGIYLYFKEKDGEYIPYYESVLNNKIYTVDRGTKAKENEYVEITTLNQDDPFGFAMGHGCTTQIDNRIAEGFDKFFAFGTLYLSSLYEPFDLLCDQDRESLKEAGQGYAYYDYYLGVKNGVDIVIVRNPYNDTIMTFNSNLNYRYEDVIKEFEKQAQTALTDEFLTTSNYDTNMQKEMGGISLRLLWCENMLSEESDLSGHLSYFEANINGKIYVIKKGE